jgi:hypothetical protein
MTRKSMRLVTFGLSGLALTATLAAQTPDLRPMAVTGMTGTLRVVQDVPCDDDVDTTTPVTAGRLELTPTDGFAVVGGKLFTLTRANLTFAGFSVTRSCLGFDRTRTYGDIGVQLAKAVSFTAASTGTPGVYAVTIPKSGFEITYATIVNGDLETGTKNPSQDVTGTIDLALGTVSMHVVLATKVHFEAGCTIFGCIINETDDGSLTANLAGTIAFPDTDADGVPDRTDNCRFTANPDQTPVPTPVVTAPANITLASCLDRDFGFAAAADVCDATPVTVTNNAPVQFALGPNTVTWTGTDGLSRTATANQTVTIVDTTDPTFTFVPLDIAMNDCGPANLGQATATDDCAGTVAITNNAPPKFFVGTTPVTWTATDVSANSTTATQNVTVVDTVPPTVSCVATNPTGSSFTVSAYDSCTSAPVIRLGSYVLSDGETIMINETGQPGVRLVNAISSDGVRHFQVGKGEAIITATDESNNVGSVACPVK